MDKRYSQDDKGFIRYDGKIYVPPQDRDLVAEVLWNSHDAPMAGHPGRLQTQELVLRDFWFPQMSQTIQKYIEGCETCQRTKILRQSPAAPLHPNQIPDAPWEHISVDLIGPLPESKGYNAILVIVDYFSKMKRLIPTNTELTSLGTALIFRREIFKHHGLPRKVISDRGPQFVSKFIIDLYKLLGIRGAPSTAYHPQTDGQTERSHQETEQYLAAFVNYRQDDWSDWLDIAEFVQNDHVHSSTKQTPFYTVYGRHPWKGIETGHTARSPDAADFAKHMQTVHDEAKASLTIAADVMKRFYDRNCGKSPSCHIGDKVWLEGKYIQSLRPTKKFDDK